VSDETPETHETQRRSAAAAASRARRIGGRSGSSAPHADPAPAPEPTVTNTVAKERPSAPPPESKPEREAPRPPREMPGWLRWAPAGALSAGAVAMIALLVVFSHGVWWAKPSGNVTRDQVLAAAKTCLAATNTYKYTALDQYAKAVHGCTTNPLTGQIDETITSLIKPNAAKLKASQTAQINRGAIETISSDGHQWTLLLFGQLNVVNSNYPKGRTDPFAAQVRMDKVHGKWLMSYLATVASPVG